MGVNTISQHYQPSKDVTRTLRLMSEFRKRTKLGDKGCVIWTGPRTERQYGMFYFEGNRIFAHRQSWICANGRAVPGSMGICHACDNPSCVNPEHLWAGTQLENMRDCSLKGRVANVTQKANGALLTEEQVREIRQLHAQGTPIIHLADTYKTKRKTISAIVLRISWKYLDDNQSPYSRESLEHGLEFFRLARSCMKAGDIAAADEYFAKGFSSLAAQGEPSHG